MKGLPGDVSAELRSVAHAGRLDDITAALQTARDAFAEERYDDVVETLLGAKADAPRSGTIRELLGLALYRLERFKEAARELAAFKRLTGRRDQDPVLADTFRADKRPERALDVLDGLSTPEVPPEVAAEGLVVAAGALRDLDRLYDAVELLRNSVGTPRTAEPYHLRLWYALADALEAKGDRTSAREWWDMIHAADPEFFDVERRRLGINP